ncbi:S49 family peptidase, partial [Billgrantia azerbaijanica]
LAVEAGMADRLGSLESLIAELAGSTPQATQQKRTVSMTTVRTTAELQAAIEAGADPATIQVAAAEPVDTDKLKADAAQAATQAER